MKAFEILTSDITNKPKQLHTLQYNIFNAIRSNKPDIVKLLLENKKTNPNIPDNRGETPLKNAILNSYEDIIKLLQSSSAKSNTS